MWRNNSDQRRKLRCPLWWKLIVESVEVRAAQQQIGAGAKAERELTSYSVPFVLGIPSTRGSIWQAKSTALASPLNTDSAM